MNWIVLAALVALGVVDVFLALDKQRTISQAYQYWFPTWLDFIIFNAGIVGLVLVKLRYPEFNVWLLGFALGYWGHVTFPNKERYGD